MGRTLAWQVFFLSSVVLSQYDASPRFHRISLDEMVAMREDENSLHFSHTLTQTLEWSTETAFVQLLWLECDETPCFISARHLPSEFSEFAIIACALVSCFPIT